MVNKCLNQQKSKTLSLIDYSILNDKHKKIVITTKIRFITTNPNGRCKLQSCDNEFDNLIVIKIFHISFKVSLYYY